jgi:hypothetical protein
MSKSENVMLMKLQNQNLTTVQMKFRLQLVFIFIFLSLTSFAQKAKDVIYLKNGSVVKGRIVGFDSLDRLKIQTYNAYSMVFSRHEIKKFIVKGNEDSASSYKTNRNFGQRSKGYINITQLGFSFGKDAPKSFSESETYTNFSFETFNGYKINPHFALGALTGFDIYSDGPLIPVGGGIRGNLLKGRVTPTVFINAGHAFEISTEKGDRKDVKGGLFWSSGAGLIVMNGANTAFTMSFVYKQQHSSVRRVNYVWENQENVTVDDKLYRRFGILFGFSF